MYRICDYCYVRVQEKVMPQDLGVREFAQILDWFQHLSVDEIILLGGEPTLHPDFPAFLATIEEKRISTRLFTNGFFSGGAARRLGKAAWIETVFFHYDANYLNHSTAGKKQFLHNLDHASQCNKRIWLRWNIDRPDNNVAELIALCKRYAANIGYSISVPTFQGNHISLTDIHHYVRSLMHFITLAHENGIEVEPARAMPLCVFDTDQLRVLKKYNKLSGRCTALYDLTVNTDLSLQLCSVTHSIHTSPVSGLRDLKEKIEFLQNEETRLKGEPLIPACKECMYSSSGECQGGCYGYKLYGRE